MAEVISLARLEEIEFTLVGQLAGSLPDPTRQQLKQTLSDLRKVKAEYLRDHPNVLRKVTTEPAPKDRPNAPVADGSLGSGVEEKLFRAPSELAGMSIYTCRGAIQIPSHGVVHTNAAHEDLHRELRGRGFRELHAIDGVGKASAAAVAMFRPDRLQRIGGNGDADFLRALIRRADVVPGEHRIEHHDGPGPAAPFYRSAAEFRRRYLNEV